MLEAGSVTNLDDVSFVEADLSKDIGWDEAMTGCTYVLHVASPFPLATPKNEDDLIIPAREGTLRTLRAAKAAGVKRVVMTSALGAISYGHERWDKEFTEKDWSDINGPGISAYMKSKTLAERAAWDLFDKEGLELAVVNPGAIFGPVLSADFAPSIQVVLRLMNGSLPGCPDLHFGLVDVRDAADLHLLDMQNPKANGERFICVTAPSMSMKAISLTLREKLGNAARRSPTRTLPSFLLRLIAIFDPAIASIVPDLGKVRLASNEKAKSLLGWEPGSSVDAVIATAESLIKYDLINQGALWCSERLSVWMNRLHLSSHLTVRRDFSPCIHA